MFLSSKKNHQIKEVKLKVLFCICLSTILFKSRQSRLLSDEGKDVIVAEKITFSIPPGLM